MKILPSSVMV